VLSNVNLHSKQMLAETRQYCYVHVMKCIRNN